MGAHYNFFPVSGLDETGLRRKSDEEPELELLNCSI